MGGFTKKLIGPFPPPELNQKTIGQETFSQTKNSSNLYSLYGTIACFTSSITTKVCLAMLQLTNSSLFHQNKVRGNRVVKGIQITEKY